MVSQVEAVVHLPTRLLVHETAKLQDLEVSGAGHHHRERQQQDTQARFEVVVTCLRVGEGRHEHNPGVERTLLLSLTHHFLPQRSETTERGGVEGGKALSSDSQPRRTQYIACHIEKQKGWFCFQYSSGEGYLSMSHNKPSFSLREH